MKVLVMERRTTISYITGKSGGTTHHTDITEEAEV